MGGRDVVRLRVTPGRLTGDPGDRCNCLSDLSLLIVPAGEDGPAEAAEVSGIVIVKKHRASGRAGISSGSGLAVTCVWGCFPSPASVGALACATGLSCAVIELARLALGDDRKPDDLAGLVTSSVSSCTPTPEMCRMRGCGLANDKQLLAHLPCWVRRVGVVHGRCLWVAMLLLLLL